VSAGRPSRRRVLAGGAATATLLLAGPAALTGCGPSAHPAEGPDPLESPARCAEADTALAAAVALMADQTGSHAGSVLAAEARALAADRMVHGATLRAEVHRARPGSVPHRAATPPVVAPPPINLDLAGARVALLHAVHAAQDEATGLVMTLPGYRAALLASIAACCASHATLLS
jgi:hypothetical protein